MRHEFNDDMNIPPTRNETHGADLLMAEYRGRLDEMFKEAMGIDIVERAEYVTTQSQRIRREMREEADTFIEATLCWIAPKKEPQPETPRILRSDNNGNKWA